MTLREAEVAAIDRAMHEADGNVSAAARTLGVDRHKIYRLLGKK